jgi:hypothetical protein
MESLKKHLEIYKINRQIRHLNREASEIIAPFHYIGGSTFYTANNSHNRPSEKSEIIRRSINDLIDVRESLRKA